MQTRPELETLISEIRQQIQAAEQASADLQVSRQNALLAGDSAKLDEIELAVEQHRKENGRRLERIALIEGELVQVDKRDRAAYIEATRERALKAVRLGEEAIRKEYAPAARKLAAALEKLSVLRQAIDEANRTLEREGAEHVPDFDHGRHVHGWQPPPITKTITIAANDRRHPKFEMWRGFYSGHGPDAHAAFLESHGSVQVEETTTPYYEPATWAKPLEKTVNLPGVIASDLPFWHERMEPTETKRAELLAALLG